MPRAPPQLRRGRALNNRSAGALGEEIALRFFLRRGYHLVERNYRTRFGELDLILREGRTLVVVEVKLRRGTGFGDPLEAVTPRKQRTIRSMTEQYLLEKSPEFDALRFDVLGVLLRGDGPRISHVEDAF